MIVSNNVSPIWQALPDDHPQRLDHAVRQGLEKAPGGKATVFFRADDVAVPGNAFSAMLALFRERSAPLNLAVVPAWLTQSRWTALKREAAADSLFCWSQHGWRHMNFEAPGAKKREFGQARSARDKRQDLLKGFKRLEEIMGADFTPVFTPPWNRCDSEAMAAMPAIGFKGISRTVGAGPDAPKGLPDFPVRMDLHTRKEQDPDASLDAMLQELVQGLASGQLGVMLHHQRMNQTSFDFLALLIDQLRPHQGLSFAHFGHLLAR
ncbi:hypothetical protein NNJEOMEG_01126 [Fundidesulfovibrio magnetotacticus]|uniref:Polysaccharide deacetylase n=1 Tax=Fundidesulfovibrio magnetotacticus TaxID=2730080 RepID=A0A6V8LYF1_9BACT|nr:polysaccharide deacetylase [Fundidesulfovibrio magnetotacticus]GFK93295.1 hypothetical protein NNJEOMEG_01126 [Fundidesulfovibrio magnetotacticus]